MAGDRANALRAEARARRMAEWFGNGRRWRIARELSYSTDNVICMSGQFWCLNDTCYKTPFGNKGIHGYVIAEVDPSTGKDVSVDGKPVRAVFGYTTIAHAAGMFPGSVGEVPVNPYGRPGGTTAWLRAGQEDRHRREQGPAA